MTQFTASEVRDYLFSIEERSSRQWLIAHDAELGMLRQFADLLEAREKAVPVRQFRVVPKGSTWTDVKDDEIWTAVTAHPESYETRILYTHPAPSEAERLAEALRVFDGSFLKELADLVSFPEDDRGCINRSFVMERVVGLRRCWDKLSATRTHSAQAQPPAASATKRERKGHTEWRQGSEKDGGGTTNYVEPVWVWDEPEQTAARVPDAETLRLHLGELTPDEVCVAKAAYRLALAAQENLNG